MRTAILAIFALAPLASGCAHTTRTKIVQAPLEVTPAQVAQQDAIVAAAQPCGVVYVHFDLDSASVASSELPMLENAAACLRADRDAKIVIEGNTDERGTEEYNLALGDRRATSVARYIKSLDVSATQVRTVSYGENKPECLEHNEGCWAKNRRAAIGPQPHATALREHVGIL